MDEGVTIQVEGAHESTLRTSIIYEDLRVREYLFFRTMKVFC